MYILYEETDLSFLFNGHAHLEIREESELIMLFHVSFWDHPLSAIVEYKSNHYYAKEKAESTWKRIEKIKKLPPDYAFSDYEISSVCRETSDNSLWWLKDSLWLLYPMTELEYRSWERNHQSARWKSRNSFPVPHRNDHRSSLPEMFNQAELETYDPTSDPNLVSVSTLLDRQPISSKFRWWQFTNWRVRT